MTAPSRKSGHSQKSPAHERSLWPWTIAAAALVYVLLVLLVDTMAVYNVVGPIHWRIFRWRMAGALAGFDLYKFAFWFLVPFLIALRWMDWGWFGVARWRRGDWILLAALAGVCLGAVLLIPLFPSLRATYTGLGSQPKLPYLAHELLWIVSWLPGWELLHRYVLLRPLMRVMPRAGWLVIPVFEGLYHLQKPLPEMAGMVVFSLFLTWWAMKRRNIALPFLAHLSIELELVLFRLVL